MKNNNHKPVIASSEEKNELESSDNVIVSGGISQSEAGENTRKWIAYIYVFAYLIIIFVGLIVGLIKFNVIETKDILLAISGVLSGPLGFIIGYYFKASSGESWIVI